MALIMTLLLVALCMIVVVAYTLATRTERLSTHAYSQSIRAELLAQAVLTRLVAAHASAADPYATDPATGRPTAATRGSFFSDTPDPSVFLFRPTPGLNHANHLMALSRAPAGDVGEPALTPRRWAYAGIQDPIFYPRDSSGNLTAPQWINYTAPDPDGTPRVIGRIAYAVWDDSGKYDVNMVGEETTINGLGRHDLRIENFAKAPAPLVRYLNGTNNQRDRSNFSLRRIGADPIANNTGDDRLFFTTEEMALRTDLFAPAHLLRFTPFSRDFEVRGDWDGNRANAQSYLKAYVNNPVFRTAYNRAMSNDVVVDTLNHQRLEDAAKAIPGSAPLADRRELALLMAVLRMVLPNEEGRFEKQAIPEYNHISNVDAAVRPLSRTDGRPVQWFDHDIAGIALNVWQASDQTNDPQSNNRRLQSTESNWRQFTWTSDPTQPQWDPNLRRGIRLVPFLTEMTVRVERLDENRIQITEYYEIWNPHAVNMRDQRIYYWNGLELMWEFRTTLTPPRIVTDRGVTGNIQPISGGGTEAEIPSGSGPAPGSFVVGRRTRSVSLPQGEHFQMVTRPIIGFTPRAASTKKEYHSGPSMDGPAPNTWGGGGRRPKFALEYFIPASELDPVGSVCWHSFQIDDPRMGTLPRTMNRDISTVRTTPEQFAADVDNPRMNYSWRRYPNSHSLFGISEGPKYTSPFGDGFNQNFGENFPDAWKSLPLDAQKTKMFSTFTIPGRSFAHLGELSSVHLFRPWRVLNLADRPTPADPTQAAHTSLEHYPSRLFDFYTTVGTTVQGVTLDAGDPTRAQEQALISYEMPDGSRRLRPIRGRVNLNSADPEMLRAILERPYRVVNYVGSGTTATSPNPSLLNNVTLDPADINGVINDILAARPLRSLGDLGRLASVPNSTVLRMYRGNPPSGRVYPDHLINAMLARLAAFGTIRQQIYTIDIAAQALHPKNPAVVTAETRMEARVYFDTFSRQSFVQSVRFK